MQTEKIANDWLKHIETEFKNDYYLKLKTFLIEERKTKEVYPKQADVFNALYYTGFEEVKVVILGQDPYHGPGQAHGLSFSVQKGVALPPSLRNIFKELTNDLGILPPANGDLTHWAKQGVLLLNTVLTVEKGKAHSHQGKGWEKFTDKIIKTLNKKHTPVVYILWGAAAQQKATLIDQNKHYLIKAPHPSPLSAYRGFFNSKPFSKVNQILAATNQKQINWQL